MKRENATSTVAEPKQEVVYPNNHTEKQRQTSNLHSRWPWVEKSIWTDSMLAALENGVKGGKWFSLIDKVFRPEVLFSAWLKVKRNRGVGGIDNITIDKFEANCLKYLSEIRKDLEEEDYRPQAVKRVYIPKGGGKTRPLGIPVVKDRVTQMALKMTIEPIFEKMFHSNSYGFRPERGAKDALREVDQLLKEGHTHVVDVDFQSFFDTIPHEKLISLVKEQISDSRVIRLIQQFLSQEVMEEMEKWTPTQGTPQGGVISPLLANIYLTPLDFLADEMGSPLIRYADDFVVLTKSRGEAEAVMKSIQEWSESVGLITHPEKTKITNYQAGEGFDFLGYHFRKGYRNIRRKSQAKIKDAIRAKTKRTSGKAMTSIIADLNKTLRGVYGYFKHATGSNLRAIDQITRRRLRAIYRKREKRPGRGRTHADHRKWPNAHFADLGLFTLAEARKQEVSVRRARLACQSR